MEFSETFSSGLFPVAFFGSFIGKAFFSCGNYRINKFQNAVRRGSSSEMYGFHLYCTSVALTKTF